MSRRPARRVSAAELRRIFNAGDYLGRVERNELLASVESERLAPPEAGQPPGTTSRMVRYYDLQLHTVAIVHEYMRPDGNRGGSGLPDPKRLHLDDETLYC